MKGCAIGDRQAVDTLTYVLRHDLSHDVKKEVAKALGRIGDLRAAEDVLDWPFMAPLEVAKKQAQTEFRMWIDGFRNLFGDYTAIILEIQIYTRSRESVSYGRHVLYSYDVFSAPLHKLCNINTRIACNILHKVIQKRDIEVKMSYDDCETYEKTENGRLSFELQREIGRKELERRGSPGYDPSAYLEREAWTL